MQYYKRLGILFCLLFPLQLFAQDITDQSKDDKKKIKEGRKPQVLKIILKDSVF